MGSIILRGAVLRHFDTRYEPEPKTVFSRAHFTADWTKEIRELLEFPEDTDLPASVPSCKLALELTASWMILTPNDSAIAQHELQLEIGSVEQFGLFRSGKEDKAKEELRFTVKTSAIPAEAAFGNFIRLCGFVQCAMKVDYTGRSTGGEEVVEDDRQTVLGEPEGAPIVESPRNGRRKRQGSTEPATGGVVTLPN